jgi:hypothetical protein
MSLFWRAAKPLQMAWTLWIDSPRWLMPSNGTLLRLFWSSHTASVESRCGAVTVGLASLLPPLSVGGAL